MAKKRMAVTLHEEEIARLDRILEDNDREDALAFIRDVLEEKVKANELPHCVPFYDAGYNPGQADSFRKGS
jgi:metal-responsive CopG/Arc/MetJ family transcriptional regulator